MPAFFLRSTAFFKLNPCKLSISPYRVLNLKRYFTSNCFKPSSSLQATLREIDEQKIEIVALHNAIDEYLKLTINNKLKYVWTYHSNALEASRLTLADTIYFFTTGLTSYGNRFKDYLAARNHANAIEYIDSMISKEVDFDPKLIQTISTLLQSGLRSNFVPGLGINRVVRLDCTPCYLKSPYASSEMGALFHWIKNNIQIQHPLITSSIAHYQMVKIQPYIDRNCARLLMNMILMQQRYAPAILQVDQKNEYLCALKQADDGDLTDFIALMARTLLQSQKTLLADLRGNSKINLPALKK